jgi:hypothetical protein
MSRSLTEGDNLRLMQPALGAACMLMGSVRRTDPGGSNQGSVEAQSGESTHVPEDPSGGLAPEVRPEECAPAEASSRRLPAEYVGHDAHPAGGNSEGFGILGIPLQQPECASGAVLTTAPGAVRKHGEGARH